MFSGYFSKAVAGLRQGRFEPIETLLALSALLHGLWLLVPYWTTSGGVVVTPAPRPVEVIVGLLLFVLGGMHLVSKRFGWQRFRQNIAFLRFMAWFFLAGLAYIATGPASIVWIAYITLALTSSIVFLNISVRDDI